MARAIVPIGGAAELPSLHPRAHYVLGVVAAINVVNLWHRYLLVSESSRDTAAQRRQDKTVTANWWRHTVYSSI